MQAITIQALAIALTVCTLLNAGLAQDDKTPAPKEINLMVPGEWLSRPTGNEKARWQNQKTPAKVTIEPGHTYALVIRDATDKHLASLSALKDVALWTLELPSSEVTDQGVANLKQLKVHSLIISSSNLTDNGVASLAEMKGVNFLYLSSCSRVTDKGLAHLKKMAGLEQLWITANSRITNDGLKAIAEMGALRDLSLYGSKLITDEGALHLAKSKSLRFVFFGGTSVTEAGIQDLKKKLPNCDVNR